MALRIERKKDQRVVKSILHRIADLPGGVTVSVKNLGGKSLLEATPIGKGADGLYQVCKTAKVITKATATDTTYEVAKGHHFVVGDKFATEKANGQTITKIDKSNDIKDVITLEATLGKVVNVGEVAFESKGADSQLKVTPIAIVGSNMDAINGDNLFVDAWLHGVIKETNAPAVPSLVKDALKSITYV